VSGFSRTVIRPGILRAFFSYADVDNHIGKNILTVSDSLP
jgi:hypothetical protein